MSSPQNYGPKYHSVEVIQSCTHAEATKASFETIPDIVKSFILITNSNSVQTDNR